MRLALILFAFATLSRAAAADPATDRVFAVPTAWLPTGGGVIATGSLDLRAVADSRAETGLNFGIGLGDIASVELGTDTDVRACDGCGMSTPTPQNLGRAAFRLGAPQDSLFHGMPAVVFGVRTTFARRGENGKASVFDDARVSEAYLVASRVLGPVRLHAGAQLTDARFVGEAGNDVTLGTTLKPMGGIEWTPPQYPKTSLMGDFVYVPRFDRNPDEAIALEWMAGWGVRFQALEWGAIELAVRHREGEGLGDSTVMVRLDGVWQKSRR